MEQLRYSTFTKVHKGLRALLFDTAILIQHTDFTKDNEIRTVTDRLNEIILLFEGHAYAEDNFVFSMVKNINPAVIDALEEEHEEDHRLSQGLQYWINMLQQPLSAEERKAAGIALLIGLNEFIAFNLLHMNKEETLVNELIWETYSDEEIRANEQKLVRNIPPEKMMRYVKWMLRGLAVYEIIEWFKEVKETAPGFVFDALCEKAEEELAAQQWNEVKKGLCLEKSVVY
jgi:hemerythrin-like domain-containing protein